MADGKWQMAEGHCKRQLAGDNLRVKWRRVIIWGLTVCGVVLIAFLVWPKREPRYGGRYLSAWLRDAIRYDEEDPEYVRAQEAVRHIGTNALPYLLEIVRYEVPEWMNTVSEATGKLPGPFGSWWNSVVEGRRDYIEQASTGFAILGDQGAPAIGALIRLLDYRDSEDGPAHALAYIGRLAVPSLLVVLTNRSRDVHQRAEAAFTLELMETNASDLVGVLKGCLDDDPEVAGSATSALTGCLPWSTATLVARSRA